jgi:hypothetical protein
MEVYRHFFKRYNKSNLFTNTINELQNIYINMFKIYDHDYLCNQCLSQLMLWVRISIRARCTTLCDKVCHWLATGQWFSPGSPVSSTNKTDRYDITEILLKVALNTIKQPNKQTINHELNILPQVWNKRTFCGFDITSLE